MNALGGAIIVLFLFGLSSISASSSFYVPLLTRLNFYNCCQRWIMRLSSLHHSLPSIVLQGFDTFLQIPVLTLLACLWLFTGGNNLWIALFSSLFFALRAQYLFNICLGATLLKHFLHENALPERKYENWGKVLDCLDESERSRTIRNTHASSYLQLSSDSIAFITYLVFLLESDLRKGLTFECWQGLIIVCVLTLLVSQKPLQGKATNTIQQKETRLKTSIRSKFSSLFLVFTLWGLVTLALIRFPSKDFQLALPYVLFFITLIAQILKTSRSISAIRPDRVFYGHQLQDALATIELNLAPSNRFLRTLWAKASLLMHNEKWVTLSAARILTSIDLQLCLLFLIVDFGKAGP